MEKRKNNLTKQNQKEEKMKKQTLMDAAAEARLAALEARVEALESAPKRGRKAKAEEPATETPAVEEPAPAEEPAVEEPAEDSAPVEE